MSRHLKCLCMCLFFSILFFSPLFPKVEAASNGWGAYGDERGAWGGNGGWWGGGHNDWYGEYGSPNYSHLSNHGYLHHDYAYPYRGYHTYANNGCVYYPPHYYDDNVDGGALYFNVK